MIKAAILTIGDEILIGQITDTNSAWLSKLLSSYGISIIEKLSVSDNSLSIIEGLQRLSEKADIVFTTGGLGPTKDDITKKAIANFAGRELKVDELYFEQLRKYFESRGVAVVNLNRNQAEYIEGSLQLHNAKGTARGIWLEINNCIIISMPGVPHEMKLMVENEVLPRIKVKFPIEPILHKYIMTAGIGESSIAAKIEDIEDGLPPEISLGYYPDLGLVKLRLSASLKVVSEATLDEIILKIAERIPEHIFALKETTLVESLAEKLIATGKTISIAESCTGGYVSHLCTSISGSSKWFKGSVVSYSNEMKVSILGVSEKTLSEHGAVSEAVVLEMASGVRKICDADYSVSISGVAGPEGGTEEKPVGTICFGFSNDKEVLSWKRQLFKTRDENIRAAAHAALFILWKRII